MNVGDIKWISTGPMVIVSKELVPLPYKQDADRDTTTVGYTYGLVGCVWAIQHPWGEQLMVVDHHTEHSE